LEDKRHYVFSTLFTQIDLYSKHALHPFEQKELNFPYLIPRDVMTKNRFYETQLWKNVLTSPWFGHLCASIVLRPTMLEVKERLALFSSCFSSFF